MFSTPNTSSQVAFVTAVFTKVTSKLDLGSLTRRAQNIITSAKHEDGNLLALAKKKLLQYGMGITAQQRVLQSG